VVAPVFALVGVLLIISQKHSPWTLVIPVTLDDERDYGVAYPVGATAYLHDHHVTANVMTPYIVGAYLSWYLHPDVLVGMDGRYDAAYQPGVVEGLMDMYRGLPGWKQTLGLYPTDLLLAMRSQPLDKLMQEQTDWPLVYRDDAFDIFARPGLTMPIVDRSGQPLVGKMP